MIWAGKQGMDCPALAAAACCCDTCCRCCCAAYLAAAACSQPAILTGLSAPYPACSVTYLKDELQMSSSQSATMTQIWSGTCYLTPLIGAFIAGGCSAPPSQVQSRPCNVARALVPRLRIIAQQGGP